MDNIFKRPALPSPSNKDFSKLLDLDNSIMHKFVLSPSDGRERDQDPSEENSPKRFKSNPIPADPFEEDDEILGSGMISKFIKEADYQDNDEVESAEEPSEWHNMSEDLERELDEHCDFTLMQFVQSSQLERAANMSQHCNIGTQSVKSNKDRKTNAVDNDFGFSQPMPLSQFENYGRFYGLPDKVKRLVKEHKGISKLYDWQDECLCLPAVQNRQNLIYALPTSSGKTLVAEILIFRELICHKRDVLFVLPFVSLVKEKVAGLALFAVDLDFHLEEYAAGQGMCPPKERRGTKNSLYIATIEKSLAVVDSLIEAGRLNEIGLVVIDELHLLGEPGRGAILETVLTKIKHQTGDTQIIGMSATIGNLHEIEQFLNATVYRREFRPVELTEYVKCGRELYTVNKEGGGGNEFLLPFKTDDFGYDEAMYKMDSDHIGGLVKEVAPQYSLLIFCPIKRNCQDVAVNLTRVLGNDFLEHKRSAKERLLNALRGDSDRMCDVLRKTIPYGIAYHHSGLTMDERRIIEDAYRMGVLCVICCTSTLAAGVNLPAKRVIIRSPYVGRDFLTQSRYKQMIGRAGRAGFDVNGESILILGHKDKQRALDQLLDCPMTDAISSMHLNEFYGLRNLILSAISLRIATTLKSLKQLCRQTLMAIQADRLGLNIRAEVEQTIKCFFKMNALSIQERKSQTKLDVSVDILPSQYSQLRDNSLVADKTSTVQQQQLVIKSSTQLEISAIGRAAVKACLDLVKARRLYDDLLNAQRGLVLLDYLHLLFIVTPPDVGIYPKLDLFYEKFNKLTPNQLHTAKLIGITESLAVKIMTGRALTPEQTALINRFFVTLILQDLWNLRNPFDVSHTYGVNRGLVQNLVSLAASYAASVSKFCQEMAEFWAFEAVLKVIAERLRHCCSVELMPLMELPSVRLSRAKQLYAHGYRTVETVAKADPQDLVKVVEFLSKRQAKQIVSAAMIMLKDKVDTLQSEVDMLRALIADD